MGVARREEEDDDGLFIAVLTFILTLLGVLGPGDVVVAYAFVVVVVVVVG
jgi:hypothetical protein